MKRWDGLVDEYVQRGATLGLSALTLGKRRRELERWGCWLKRRRPRVKLEEVGGEQCIDYIRSRTRFHAKATVAGVSSELRCFGEYLVSAGVWAKNPMRWVRVSGPSRGAGGRSRTRFAAWVILPPRPDICARSPGPGPVRARSCAWISTCWCRATMVCC